MGRHTSRDIFPSAPVLRLATPRTRQTAERTVPGVLFPIVDDLSQIAADDRLLDYLAAGRADYGDLFGGSSSSVAVAPMLATWRAEFTDSPLPEAPSLPAVRRVMRGPAKSPGRALRPILGVAAAICAVIVGSAAVGAQSAQPGDTLWPLTRVLYSSHANSVQARIAVNNSIAKARGFLDQSLAPMAVQPLKTAAIEILHVDPADGQGTLQVVLQRLQAQVSSASTAAVQADAVTQAARVSASSAAASSQAAAAKNNAGGAKHTAPVSGTAKAGTKPATGKTSTAPTNGAPATNAAGSIVPGLPGVQILPPPAPTTVGAGAPTTDAGSPGTTAPVVPPSPPDASTTPAPDTTSQAPQPTTTDPGTPTDPGTDTTSQAPSTDASTTSEMPTPTPTPTDDGSGAQVGANGAASVGDVANASQ